MSSDTESDFELEQGPELVSVGHSDAILLESGSDSGRIARSDRRIGVTVASTGVALETQSFVGQRRIPGPAPITRIFAWAFIGLPCRRDILHHDSFLYDWREAGVPNSDAGLSEHDDPHVYAAMQLRHLQKLTSDFRKEHPNTLTHFVKDSINLTWKTAMHDVCWMRRVGDLEEEERKAFAVVLAQNVVTYEWREHTYLRRTDVAREREWLSARMSTELARWGVTFNSLAPAAIISRCLSDAPTRVAPVKVRRVKTSAAEMGAGVDDLMGMREPVLRKRRRSATHAAVPPVRVPPMFEEHFWEALTTPAVVVECKQPPPPSPPCMALSPLLQVYIARAVSADELSMLDLGSPDITSSTAGVAPVLLPPTLSALEKYRTARLNLKAPTATRLA